MSRSHTVTAEVYVDLEDFDTDELIAELRTRRLDSEEVSDLQAIVRDKAGESVETEIDRATYELRLGRRTEALIWLERALPRDWMGRLVP